MRLLVLVASFLWWWKWCFWDFSFGGWGTCARFISQPAAFCISNCVRKHFASNAELSVREFWLAPMILASASVERKDWRRASADAVDGMCEEVVSEEAVLWLSDVGPCDAEVHMQE